MNIDQRPRLVVTLRQKGGVGTIQLQTGFFALVDQFQRIFRKEREFGVSTAHGNGREGELVDPQFGEQGEQFVGFSGLVLDSDVKIVHAADIGRHSTS